MSKNCFDTEMKAIWPPRSCVCVCVLQISQIFTCYCVQLMWDMLMFHTWKLAVTCYFSQTSSCFPFAGFSHIILAIFLCSLWPGNFLSIRVNATSLGIRKGGEASTFCLCPTLSLTALHLSHLPPVLEAVSGGWVVQPLAPHDGSECFPLAT